MYPDGVGPAIPERADSKINIEFFGNMVIC
jgi:hypothetical protein